MEDPRPTPSVRELGPGEVRFAADLSPFGIGTSDDLSPSLCIVGQSDAMEALALGLKIDSAGFNLFLTGSKGTGRFAAVRQMIDEVRPDCPVLFSYCYVHNFAEPEAPMLITLAPGRGKALQQAIDGLRQTLRETVPSLLGSEIVTRSRERLMAKWDREARHLFEGFEERVGGAGFRMVHSGSPDGSVQLAEILPLVNGEPVPMEQVRADPREAGLELEELQSLEHRRRELKQELSGIVIRHRQVGSRYRRLLKDAEARRIGEALEPVFQDIKEAFASEDANVATYLAALQTELLEHLDYFREPDATSPPRDGGPRIDDFLSVVQVNLVWDPGMHEGATQQCPVVEENYPTFRNLFGTVEAAGEPPMSTFLDIRAGSLLRANGGFLLLSARDILTEPRVYETLKRALRKELLEIAPREDGMGVRLGLKPTPIPLRVKVVLVGEPSTYELLFGADPDFRKVFKVKVEFDDLMERNEAHTRAFLSVLKRIIEGDGLPPFDRRALEVLVEEGVRLAGNRMYLSTQFSDLADVMREASWLAGQRGGASVSGADMERALLLRAKRVNLPERRMLDFIREGKMLIEVEGTRVGQVNGLGFYDLDYVQFGMPARISATCGTGRRGVVNIEREAALSGSVHDKGVLILDGFLASSFAQDKPLSLHANIAFEQSYVTVDGDSASLAELMALLSALSRIPLRQDLAVTGSLSQRGGVQPVGGVTEKVQGFFRACALKKLTGTQGVILPEQNVGDLHLDRELTNAIEAGRFHLYPVNDFSQALELLTGREVADVLAECNKTLRSYAEIVRDFS